MFMSRMEIVELQDSLLQEAKHLAERARKRREGGQESYFQAVTAMAECAKGAKALQDVLDNGPGWVEKR